MKLKYFSLLLILVAIFSFIFPLATQADIPISIVDPNSQYSKLTGYKPSDLVRTTITIIFGASGIAAFIYLLWGGYQYITAGGDKEGTEKAKKKISGALVGLALVFSSYALALIVQILFNISILGFTLSPLGASSSSPPGNSGGPPGIAACPCNNGLCAGVGTVANGGGGACFVCNAGGWSSQGTNTCGGVIVSCGTCN